MSSDDSHERFRLAMRIATLLAEETPTNSQIFDHRMFDQVRHILAAREMPSMPSISHVTSEQETTYFRPSLISQSREHQPARSTFSLHELHDQDSLGGHDESETRTDTRTEDEMYVSNRLGSLSLKT